MRHFLIITLFIASSFVYAGGQFGDCSDWVRNKDVSCGKFQYLAKSQWTRFCERPCGRYSYSECDNDIGCFPKIGTSRFLDPNYIEGPCTDWVEMDGANCRNRSTGDWEQMWKRTCLVGGYTDTRCKD